MEDGRNLSLTEVRTEEMEETEEVFLFEQTPISRPWSRFEIGGSSVQGTEGLEGGKGWMEPKAQM